jgi:hypothetical protein
MPENGLFLAIENLWRGVCIIVQAVGWRATAPAKRGHEIQTFRLRACLDRAVDIGVHLMKKLMFGLMMAAALGLAGCQKSVESEVKDVKDAQQNAAERVTDKERELQDTKLEEGKKIQEEKREANDAINRELNKDPAVTPAPAVTPTNP